jgi:hypothetical protein
MAEKPLPYPLQPSSLHVVESDGTEHEFQSEVYNDLIWLYMHFKMQKEKYKEVVLYECTGARLKIQLRVGFTLAPDGMEDDIIFENTLAEQIHESSYMET